MMIRSRAPLCFINVAALRSFAESNVAAKAKSIFIVQSMRVRYASRVQAGKGMAVDVEQPDWLVQIEGILESLNEGVLITDECQAIVFANSNLEEMTGFARAELVGLDIYSWDVITDIAEDLYRILNDKYPAPESWRFPL